MKKENKKIVVVITIISLCILSGYFIIKSNYNGLSKTIDKSNDKDVYEEINLGDSAHCTHNSAVPASVCSGKTKEECDKSSSCYWVPAEIYCFVIEDNKCQSKSFTGKTSCNDVTGGYKEKKDCEDNLGKEITDVSISASAIYFTPSEASGQFGTASSSGGEPTSWSVTGNFSLGGSDSTSRTINFSNPTKGSGTTPAANDVTVTASNSKNSKTSNTKTAYVYGCNWSTSDGYWKFDASKPLFYQHYNIAGCNFYSGYKSENGVSYYTKWHGRCCTTVGSEGVSSNEAPPVEDFGHCYGDNPYRALANSVKWVPGPAKSGYGYIYNDITDINQCKLYDDAVTCTSGVNNSSPKTVVANKCEDNVSFDVTNSSKVCSSGNSSFYKIVCTTKVTTGFDMDDNIVKANYTMYSGLGFKFNIDVVEKTECVAEFNLNEWENSYNKIMTKLKAVEHSSVGSAYAAYQRNDANAFSNYANNLTRNSNAPISTVSRLIELYKKAKAIEGLVDDYNSYRIKDNSNSSTTLELTYLDKGKNQKVNATYQFESEMADCNPTKRVSKTHSGIKKSANWLTPPQNYTETYTRSINLYPSSVLISKATGEILNKNTTEKNVLDGGNKVYISNSAAAQTIPLRITVNGLARNNSKIQNNKCSLKISERNLIYRPIDVANPFIDSSWKKGENWVNTMYDFTKTIHANTWSEKSIYKINLPSEMISEIKTSNARNNSSDPYLGLCSRQKYELQDSVTRNLCSLIK